MKTFLVMSLYVGVSLTASAQDGRFWQLNLGTDRRTAILQQIYARHAVMLSDYLGPQASLEKVIQVQGRFDGSDSIRMKLGFVSPIHTGQEDLLYSGTAFLQRESPEAYATTFYEYFRKLQSRYGQPSFNQHFNAGDSITEAVFLAIIHSGTEFRLNWKDTATGINRALIYKPDRPEKLLLDYHMVDILRLTRYLKDASDY